MRAICGVSAAYSLLIHTFGLLGWGDIVTSLSWLCCHRRAEYSMTFFALHFLKHDVEDDELTARLEEGHPRLVPFIESS